jgi:2-dehydro-3-deoxygluconokinase
MNLKFISDAKFDLVSLGEVMLRLDPGETRIRAAREFRVWEGGGEYNVARGLSKCFDYKTAIVTALVDNEIGRLVEDLILAGGVSTEFIEWVDFDQVGRTARNGLNFTERGFGIRGGVGISDRGHTAVSQLKVGQIPWQNILSEMKTRIFHTGGIFARLSETTPDVILEAIKIAKANGSLISYDFNYRASLWSGLGGKTRAQEVSKLIAPHVDIMIGGVDDFVQSLGTNSSATEFTQIVPDVLSDYPNLQVIATTNRGLTSASRNSYSAVGWSKAEGFKESPLSLEVEVLDRVGAGDSFVSGLMHGLFTGKSLADSLNYGVAHGALTMTTPGDNSMASLADVEAVISGGSASLKR